ncbi:MAG: MotA/TolQ/ExbB proton channel family protein [Synechococcales cyanobacterium M58_A2018_015]|nr:MotA/TolQ/ExbB proton channel family protein [Synechococcales cyanobacterium M58_A2018_015]
MRVLELFAAGGVVMYPLLGFSIMATALIAERIAFWLRINRRQRQVARDVLKLYQQDPDAALLKLKQEIDLPISRIFLEALTLEQLSPNAFRLALESATQAEIPLLKRFNTFFDIVITASPLLGLLGTVLGLIRSFASINLGNIGTQNAGNVTAGISEALVSTAFGITVAVLTLVFARAFRGLYQQQLTLIREYGTQLELLYLHRYENQQSIQGVAQPYARS